MSCTLCIKVMRGLAHPDRSACIYIGVSRKLLMLMSIGSVIAIVTSFGPCISYMREEPGKLALEVARPLLLKGLFVKEAAMTAVLCDVEEHRSVTNLLRGRQTATGCVVKEGVIAGIDEQSRDGDPLQDLPRVHLHSRTHTMSMTCTRNNTSHTDIHTQNDSSQSHVGTCHLSYNTLLSSTARTQ